MGKAVDILSDILLGSNLDERAVARERDVILREMAEARFVFAPPPPPCCSPFLLCPNLHTSASGAQKPMRR